MCAGRGAWSAWAGCAWPPGAPSRHLWRARNGARWRAVSERYGKWNTAWRRFARWRFARCRDEGLFEPLFEAFAPCGAGAERVQTLDGTMVRAHQHATGDGRGCEAEPLGRPRCGSSTKIQLRRDHRGLPPAIVLAPGQRHEARTFGDLAEGLPGPRAASSATWAATPARPGRLCW